MDTVPTKKEFVVDVELEVHVNAANEAEARRFIDRELNADRDNKLNDYLGGYEVKKVYSGDTYWHGTNETANMQQSKKRLFNFRKKKNINEDFFPY